jgi:hypothetical protein
LIAGAWPQPQPAPEPAQKTAPTRLETALLEYAAAHAAGPIPRLADKEQRRQAHWGLRHISALDPERGVSFVSIHHRAWSEQKGQSIFPGSAHATIETAVSDAIYWSDRGHDAYWSMGAQGKPGEHYPKRPHPSAIRQGWNVRACPCLYIDIDVKADAYASTLEAAEALLRFVRMLMWEPTMVVGSGNGGLHV